MTGRRPTTLAVVALVAVLAVLAAGALTACSSSEREPQTVEVVVPVGTQLRLDAGETVDIMPARIELHVGDTLLIRNHDYVAQTVGPYDVAANSEVSFTYGAPGEFEGYCPLSEGERYEIVVKP